MYASLGIFSAIPISHLVLIESFFQNGDPYSTVPSVGYYLAMGAAYLGGLYIYAIRWPEKSKPGHYDLCGASH